MIEIEDAQQLKAFLVGVVFPGQNSVEMENSLKELESLVEAIDLSVVGGLLASIRKTETRFLVTSGKADEILSAAASCEAEIIIFDTALSPSQQRNWEKACGITVIDREEVILDIFSDRAQTKEASLQVELARRQYDLPRLTRAWSHLSRQRGGQKGTRDAGETQLELDRRIVLKRIARLKNELEQVRRGRDVMRKQRSNRPVPSISIVGYTNAGKSTLLNALCGSEVMAADMLFATLDPTSRQTKLPSGTEVILTDTVGFIRNLPHHLIDAFRSTLEETLLADFLIHVIDLSDEDYQSHIETTQQVLEDLGVGDKPKLVVFNKVDLASKEVQEEGKINYPKAFFLSAKKRSGFESLLDEVEKRVSECFEVVKCLIPFAQYELISLIRKEGRILSESHTDDGTIVEAALTPRLEGKLQNFFID